MKTLIIGSEGFVGNNLVKGLSKNHEIFSADMIEKSIHENYSQLDITNQSSVEKTVKDFDVVVNLAAHSLVSSLEGIIENARINIIGLLNVLEACRKNNVKKIIFTSASSMIGNPQSEKVSENHPALPKTAYGITKLTSEHYLRLYKELYGINYVIFRFFNIYGPYQKNGLIPSLYNRITKNESLTVFGKGDQIRDYVFIEDVIPFFDKAISVTVGDNSIFNIGTGKGTSINQVIEILSKILNNKPEIQFKSELPGEIGNFVADTTHLKSTFGEIPNTSISEGLKSTVCWLKENFESLH